MRLHWPASLRARLTLWYSVLLALPLVAFAVASYVVVGRALQNRTDRFLGDALTTFSRELLAERRSAETVTVAVRKTLDEVHFRDLHIAILDSGVVLASTGFPEEAPFFPGREGIAVRARLDSLLAPQAHIPGVFHTIRAGAAFRILAVPLALDNRPLLIVGAYSLGDLEGVLRGLQRLFAGAIPLLIGAAAAGGFALARRSLAPVAAMADRAAEITASRLGERLPVGGARELAALAQVINQLLDRLEDAFSQQRRFVADASHELRTPTAIVRSEAEVTLSRPHREEAEYRESMMVIQDAASRLTRVVEDLFLLARADAGHQVVRAEPLYLEDVVQDAVRAMSTVARGRNVAITVTESAELPLSGDADLLGRLVLNLLDNAVRYSPPGGVIEVGLIRRNGRSEIQVRDQGPGIPSGDQDRIFEPFFRGDAARSREAGAPGGAGLGLAIARRIAEMHSGTLQLVESGPGRTVFRVSLPGR